MLTLKFGVNTFIQETQVLDLASPWGSDLGGDVILFMKIIRLTAIRCAYIFSPNDLVHEIIMYFEIIFFSTEIGNEEGNPLLLLSASCNPKFW